MSGGMVDVRPLLEIVKFHAEVNGWCGNAETLIELYVGLQFVDRSEGLPDGVHVECLCASCETAVKEARLEGWEPCAERFTLVEGCSPMLTLLCIEEAIEKAIKRPWNVRGDAKCKQDLRERLAILTA